MTGVPPLRTVLGGRTTPDLQASLARIQRRMIENGEEHWTHKHDAYRVTLIEGILRGRARWALDWLAG